MSHEQPIICGLCSLVAPLPCDCQQQGNMSEALLWNAVLTKSATIHCKTVNSCICKVIFISGKVSTVTKTVMKRSRKTKRRHQKGDQHVPMKSNGTV